MHPVPRETNGQCPARLPAAPINRRCRRLPSVLGGVTVRRFILFGLPHHLQATHLVFGPTPADPKHFLPVTQPPRREVEGDGGGVDWQRWTEPERKSAME